MLNGIVSGESRKFFLPVLRQKPRTAVKVKKIFVVADKKRQMSKWVLDIYLSSHKILNALTTPKTLNFNELWNITAFPKLWYAYHSFFQVVRLKFKN